MNNTGFNRTGVLSLKNITDKIEYHLYDNKLPYPLCMESIDLNEKFRLYTYNTLQKLVHISISDDSGVIFTGKGKLTSKYINKVEKFYLDVEGYYVDLEIVMFDNTEKKVTIQIEAINADNNGGNIGNEQTVNKS